MIDKDGFLRCDGCNKKFGQLLPGGIVKSLVILCPRSNCKKYNVFNNTKPLTKTS